jgi:hypothetical protein
MNDQNIKTYYEQNKKEVEVLKQQEQRRELNRKLRDQQRSPVDKFRSGLKQAVSTARQGKDVIGDVIKQVRTNPTVQKGMGYIKERARQVAEEQRTPQHAQRGSIIPPNPFELNQPSPQRAPRIKPKKRATQKIKYIMVQTPKKNKPKKRTAPKRTAPQKPRNRFIQSPFSLPKPQKPIF